MDDCCELDINELRQLDEEEYVCTDCMDRLYNWSVDLDMEAYLEQQGGNNG